MAYVTALALAGLVAAVCFLEPGSTPFLPPCPFHLLTGFYCPGCGTQVETEYLPPGHPITEDIELDIPRLKERLAKGEFVIRDNRLEAAE